MKNSGFVDLEFLAEVTSRRSASELVKGIEMKISDGVRKPKAAKILFELLDEAIRANGYIPGFCAERYVKLQDVKDLCNAEEALDYLAEHERDLDDEFRLDATRKILRDKLDLGNDVIAVPVSSGNTPSFYACGIQKHKLSGFSLKDFTEWHGLYDAEEDFFNYLRKNDYLLSVDDIEAIPDKEILRLWKD